MKEKGLILLTGPTGSGKSTTLVAMIEYVNENKSCHIITVEDPVEYFHSSKFYDEPKRIRSINSLLLKCFEVCSKRRS